MSDEFLTDADHWRIATIDDVGRTDVVFEDVPYLTDSECDWLFLRQVGISMADAVEYVSYWSLTEVKQPRRYVDGRGIEWNYAFVPKLTKRTPRTLRMDTDEATSITQSATKQSGSRKDLPHVNDARSSATHR